MSQTLDIAAFAARLGSSDLSLADRLRSAKTRLIDRMPVLPMTCSREVHCTDVLGWLQNQPELPRVYWSSRDGDFEIAGSGTVLTLDSRDPAVDPIVFIRSVEKLIEACGEQAPFFVGGFRFDRNRGTGRQWQSFPSAWFVVPESVIVRIGNRCFHVASTSVDSDTAAEQILGFGDYHAPTITVDRNPADSLGADMASRVDTPDFRSWQAIVQQCLSSISSKETLKIVMARRTDFELPDEINPITLYSSLAAETGDCFGYMVEFDHGGAFLGASPERLFRLSGNTLVTEAVAGTSTSADEGGSVVAKASEKEAREHGLVEDFVLGAVRTLCDDAEVSATRSPLYMKDLIHFRSEIIGRLREGVGIGDIVARLHPTPAVGGFPRENALQMIRQLEPFDRGWYAAPFGVMSYGFADFSVSIRSVAVSKSAISLYSGAGIVNGSDPKAEWDELERKLRPHLRVLSGVRD